ncbi:hypothetical protein J4413_01680 [Candidatus Woesearchaeota archaeon]|nr:hypothetical protein [Candidatus Woesearchaeota archaeon]
MEYKFFGILYRNGSVTASNSVYMWVIDRVLTLEERETLRLDHVRTYDNLSGEQGDKVGREVDRYKGPEDALIQKIDKILGTDQPA